MLLNLAFASPMILHLNLRQAGGMEFGKKWFYEVCWKVWFFSLCRIGIKLPDTEDGVEMWIKEDKLSDLRIYFHELGKFTLHKYGLSLITFDYNEFFFICSLSEDYPDSFILDMSWLRYQKENLIRLSYVKSSSLSSLERPCVDDPGYNFRHCVEEFYSRQYVCIKIKIFYFGQYFALP